MRVSIPGYHRGGLEGAGRNRGPRLFALVRALASVLAALVVGSSVAAPASAGAAAANEAVAGGKLHLRKNAIAAAVSGTKLHWACPEGACQAIVVEHQVKIAEGTGEREGLDPQDLQSAYNIPTTLSEPQTIALIDAFGYPKAEADLAKYRKQYGLPACTKANGCFKKVNESGEEAGYPPEEPGWDVEAALDEDMASAACPQCHIIMVEGSGELPADLGKSVNTAVKLGATEISNSYGYPEKDKSLCGDKGCSQYNKDYEHPEVLITAASGDSGYADTYFGLGYLTTNFPASSPDVIAVGGTALFKEEEVPRKWFEEVWNEPFLEIGTGSGCAKFESKPAWQTDTGCKKRTDNDVAAVAAAVTPVSVRIDGFWELVAGTSVASPLVAGIKAHAGPHERSLGARMLYEDPGSLFDITQGFDWDPYDETGTSECAPNEYLCNAEVGYDGPTGLGTPNGVPKEEEVKPAAPVVTTVTPDTGPERGGKKVKIAGTGFEGATEVKFGSAEATGFTVHSAKLIAAQAPAGTGAVNVTVTTAAGTSATSSATEFTYG
jgi:IPT/TIG domain/Subtilase family